MRKILAAAMVLAFATPAFANQCPGLMKQIDEKLAMATVSDADKARIEELRKQGDEAHAAGDHAAAEAALNEALALLE